MNRSIIIYMLGWIMNMEAIFMTLPVVTAVVYRESIGFIYLGVAAVCGLLGFMCTRKKPCTKMFFAREGFVTVSLGWIVLSFFGCMPFVISGEIPHIIDAMFEIVSGFTTTGSSIIPKVEDMSHATLMWRSFSHWIGGMGILVFILAILPMAGDYNMHIMRAESPGPSVGKLVPKIRITAKLLYSIYFCMTIVMMILLLLGKMPLFDSICMSFGAAGTGGFACRNSGQADYTVYQQAVITIFMLLFGVNFNVYYLLLIRRPKDAGRCEELMDIWLWWPLPSCSSPSISGACSRPCLWHSTRRRSRFPPLSPQRDTPPLITTAGRSFPKQSCCSSCLSAPVPAVRAEA